MRIFLFLSLPVYLLGFNESFPIEYLTINEGLSGNYITSIHQDRLGYLWFGTPDGLNRYDGQAFTIFRNIPGDSSSLSDNHIRSINENSKGTLFITTNTGGLNIFHPEQESFTRIDLKDSFGNRFESLSVSSCLDDDLVWIGTQDGYVMRYNAREDSLEWMTRVVKDFENTEANIISALYAVSADTLWIASRLGGLDLLTFPGGKFQHILLADTLQESFRRNGCGGIISEPNGKLWISRVSGLDSYDPRTQEHHHHEFKDCKGEMLKAFKPVWTPSGEIVLSSYYDLIRFNPVTGSSQSMASILPQYFSEALMFDSTGILWAGTRGWGAVKIDHDRGRFNATPGNFLSEIFPDIFALLADSAGLDLTLRERDFLSIMRDQADNVWVTTQFWGIYRIDHQTQAIRNYHLGQPDARGRYHILYESFQDRKGQMWVTTAGGIFHLNPVTGQFVYHRLYPGEETAPFALNKLNNMDITSVHVDESNVFWLGTPALGLISYDPATDAKDFFPLKSNTGITHNTLQILCLAEDPLTPDQVLWVGTRGGGLVRFEKQSKSYRFFTNADGLPNMNINGILSSGAYIWLSSNGGLSRFDPVNEACLNFDIRDGLQSNGFNQREAYKTKTGALYFGGSYGYNHFQANDITMASSVAPIVLTGIQLLNEPLQYGDPDGILTAPIPFVKSLVLDPDHRLMVTLNYTALRFSNAHRNRFIYQLENFDTRWIRNGNKHSAVYTNLNPGSYRFKVRYEGDADAVAPPELALDIVILPTYWETWWFRVLMLVVFLAAMVYLLFRQYRHLSRKRLQQQQFSQQLLEYEERERKRISGELHDGVGQNLLVIKNMLQLGLNGLTANDQNSETLLSASSIVSETIQEVRNISHNLSPQHLEQLGLTSTLESAIENVEKACKIRFKVEIEDIDNLLPPESEILVYRIVQESLNNIIKHSQATAVEVSIKRNAEMIFISISDNGVGFMPAASSTPRGIGLSGMEERAQLLQGRITIGPGKDSGTLVQLIINVDK